MENFKVEKLSFIYPTNKDKALDNISFNVRQGEFILVCGKSGCGKTTLLRLLKPTLAPFGELNGSIYFNGKPLSNCDVKEQTSKIGFVMQNAENQIVTDKVWHELAFGLESLGCETSEIRMRVSEMASFFGIQDWFYKNVSELSGGQKQLLNLASVMVMQPSVLILDEPLSQLDPIATGEFLKILEKVNRELGITVILAEHRLEDVFSIADRVIVMDKGRIIADEVPEKIGEILKTIRSDMYKALPTPVRIHGEIPNSLFCPVTIKEGRHWLMEYAKENQMNSDLIPNDTPKDDFGETAVEINNVWFRYERNSPDVIKGLNMTVKKGELYCLVGGNGTGKTTALSLISGINSPQRGDVLIKGKNISRNKDFYNGILGVLPQNPQAVFVKKTVYLDLVDILKERQFSKEEKEEKVHNIALLCRIENVLNSHPFDLSGGEQQRAALAKILLTRPEILLLDEPTKGMDASFKEELADILLELKSKGTTIIMVSHDIEFCAEYADRCALFFDGNITSEGTPRKFFKGKNFYTTAANRMARNYLPDAVLTDDIILACGGNVEERKKQIRNTDNRENYYRICSEKESKKKLTPARIITGSIFALVFFLISLSFIIERDVIGIAKIGLFGIQLMQIISVAVAFFCFFPQSNIEIKIIEVSETGRRFTKRTLWSTLLILVLIPLTIYTGVFFFGSRKYYFTSLLIIAETIIPFFMMFEARKPKARELIIVSVLCALAVAGRAVFFMLPEFKPVVFIVIIAGVCFGGETGFLVGMVSGFVSNFFFGQGPWTPWQMFAFGIIGFIAGIFFKIGFVRRSRMSLSIFGFLTTLIIYGGIMNSASVIMWQNKITWKMLASAYIAGFPFDLIHAFSNVFFIWFLSEPIIDKLERVKVKYGLIKN